MGGHRKGSRRKLAESGALQAVKTMSKVGLKESSDEPPESPLAKPKRP